MPLIRDRRPRSLDGSLLPDVPPLEPGVWRRQVPRTVNTPRGTRVALAPSSASLEGGSNEGPRRSGTGRALRVPSRDYNRSGTTEPASLSERFSSEQEPGTPRRRNTQGEEVPDETVSETVARGEEVPGEAISEAAARMCITIISGGSR